MLHGVCDDGVASLDGREGNVVGLDVTVARVDGHLSKYRVVVDCSRIPHVLVLVRIYYEVLKPMSSVGAGVVATRQ